jgi:hypothetical protein
VSTPRVARDVTGSGGPPLHRISFQASSTAAARYPGLSRAQLLTRLALEGHEAAQQAQGERRRHRLAVLRAHSGRLTGAYGPRYLDQLREEWPA